MIHAEKHLLLLSKMEKDGLKPEFTGGFSEEALEQACKKIETLDLREWVQKGDSRQIQRELIRTSGFAELYQAMHIWGME